VSDALTELQEREDNVAQKREVIKAMIQYGLDSCEPTDFQIENFLANSKKRHLTGKGKKDERWLGLKRYARIIRLECLWAWVKGS